MDALKAIELSKIADAQIEQCKRYEEYRIKAGKAKSDLHILLASKLRAIRAAKSNIGLDMAILVLCEENQIARDIYREYNEAEANYKGLEKVIEAYASKISLEQSVLRYLREGEKFG